MKHLKLFFLLSCFLIFGCQNSMYNKKLNELSSFSTIVHSDANKRMIIYLTQSGIYKSTLHRLSWKEESIKGPYKDYYYSYILGSGNHGTFVVCYHDMGMNLMNIKVDEDNGTISYNELDRIYNIIEIEGYSKPTLLFYNTQKDNFYVSEVFVSQGELVKNTILENVWLEWNSTPCGSSWNEATLGTGEYWLLGTTSKKFHDLLLSDNHSWTMNEIRMYSNELEQVLVLRETGKATSLKKLIDIAISKVPQNQKITDVSPFSVCYGKEDMFTSHHVFSVITGIEYKTYGGFHFLSNAAKVLWYQDAGTLKSINILNNEKQDHGTFVDIVYYSDYIRLKDKMGDYKYINYYGYEVDKKEEHSFIDSLFDWSL